MLEGEIHKFFLDGHFSASTEQKFFFKRSSGF